MDDSFGPARLFGIMDNANRVTHSLSTLAGFSPTYPQAQQKVYLIVILTDQELLNLFKSVVLTEVRTLHVSQKRSFVKRKFFAKKPVVTDMLF